MAASALSCLRLAASLAAVAVATAVVTLPPLPLYDCNVEFDDWEIAWTPEWKAWCCEHQLRGCPTTITSTATMTLTATAGTSTVMQTPSAKSTPSTARAEAASETQATSETEAEMETATATTTSTVTATTTTTVTATTTTTATVTATATATATTTTTATVTATATTTTPTAGATTAPTSAAKSRAAVASCSNMCEVKGYSATCGERILWASTHDVANEVSPCEAAHVLVTSQCPEACGGCTAKAAHCNAAPHGPARVFEQKFRAGPAVGRAAPDARGPVAVGLAAASAGLAGLLAWGVRRRGARAPEPEEALLRAGPADVEEAGASE